MFGISNWGTFNWNEGSNIIFGTFHFLSSFLRASFIFEYCLTFCFKYKWCCDWIPASYEKLALAAIWNSSLFFLEKAQIFLRHYIRYRELLVLLESQLGMLWQSLWMGRSSESFMGFTWQLETTHKFGKLWSHQKASRLAQIKLKCWVIQ